MSQNDIDATKAPLLEHLIELRQRLMWAIAALGAAFVLCYAFFADDIFNMLLRPLQQATGADPERRVIFTAPQEKFFVDLKVAVFAAFCLTFPVIAGQLWAFVAPGLYRDERRAFLPFLVATPVLFLIGGSIVYFIVMPLALDFFLGFEQQGGAGLMTIELETKVSEYLSLIMTLILAFGICFQLPVLLVLLARVGMTSAASLRSGRKYAIVGVFAAAALLTPPDPISQVGLALPIILLYEISILLVARIEAKQAADSEFDDDDDD